MCVGSRTRDFHTFGNGNKRRNGGGMGKECSRFLSQLANKLATKQNEPYTTIISWINSAVGTGGGWGACSPHFTMEVPSPRVTTSIPITLLWKCPPPPPELRVIRVKHVNGMSNRNKGIKGIFRNHELAKKREYTECVLEVEQETFTPLVMGTNGGMGEEWGRNAVDS